MKKFSSISLSILILLLISPLQTFSAEPVKELRAIAKTVPSTSFNINIDKATIDKGYTVTAFNDDLKLSLVPGILSEATPVEIHILDEPLEMPWSLDRVSKVYQFEFKNKQAYDNSKPYYIQMAYEKANNQYKKVFFFDKNYNTWRPLPTKDFPDKKFVRSLIHLPYARIAIFSFPETVTDGKASWYAYKGGMFAASPDYPKGSRLRVTNKENNKFVDVTVNDYGPDRAIHPDRPVDLDKLAFAKIADLSQGIIDVSIEPLMIAKDTDDLELGIPEKGIGAMPISKVRSAIVVDAENGDTIYAKNATTTLPLASLTKIVAVYTFLQEKIDLDKVVAYKSSDADFNYKYCRPWESSKLNVPDGEKMTVKDLVYTSLIGSTNNTVETLVRVSGLKRDDFIKNMNDIVASWGASSTKFVEPTGLSPENVTSAADYAIIANKVLENKLIAAASVTTEYKFTTITNKINKKIKNTDKMIKVNRFNIVGSKTGYLDEALYCLMTKVNTGSNKSIIVVTFGAKDRDTSFRETEKLIQYGAKMQQNSI